MLVDVCGFLCVLIVLMRRDGFMSFLMVFKIFMANDVK